MLRRRRTRLLLLSLAIAIGVFLILLITRDADKASMGTPMDIEWAGGFGYTSMAEGQILRLDVRGDRIDSSVIVDDLQFPRGIAIDDDTLYVAELGPLPCEQPVPRCKGENIGPTIAEGERQLIASSSGRILAFPIIPDGLGEPSVLVDGLHFTNTDHGLNDLDLGPDGMLYLSVGNLDQLAWDDGGDPPTGPETELLGACCKLIPLRATSRCSPPGCAMSSA